MSDDRVKVQLPDKMEVHAPETDKAIDSLHEVFKAISAMLERFTTEVTGSLRTLAKLPEMLGKAEQTMVKQFSTLFEYQVKIAAGMRVANLETGRRRQQAAQEAMASRQQRLEGERQLLQQRYDTLLGEVASDCESNVRSVDSHAFEIVDGIYPKQIQARFALNSMPAVKQLADHADESAMARGRCLDEKLEPVAESISNTRTRIATFNTALADLAGGSTIPAGWHMASYYILEVTDAKGSSHLELVLDGHREVLATGSSFARRLKEKLVVASTESTLAPDDLEALAKAMHAGGLSSDDVQHFMVAARRDGVKFQQLGAV